MNPYIDPLIVDNIKNDTFQFGLAMLISQIAAGHNLFANNCANTKSILLTLLGFMTVQLILGYSKFPDKVRAPFFRVTIDDSIKFGFAILIGKLADWKSMTFANTGLEILHITMGFAFYNLIISKYLISLIVKPGMSLNHIMALNDTFKFTFVLLLSGILNNMTGIGKINLEYVRLTLGYVAGIVGYDVFLA